MQSVEITNESINLIIKPTDSCNLRCKHCYAADTGYASCKMHISTVARIFELFADSYNNINIIWHGGEPLLMGMDFYKNVIEIQKKYINTKFHNSMQTNATLINSDWIDFLKRMISK